MRLRARSLPLPRRHLLSAAGVCLASGAMIALGIPAVSGPADGAAGRVGDSVPRLSASGQAFTGVPAVGALFPLGGKHFCTASIVHSPAGDLAVTAAHCVSSHGAAMVFIPGFHDGQAPYGTWQVTRVYTDPAWAGVAGPRGAGPRTPSHAAKPQLPTQEAGGGTILSICSRSSGAGTQSPAAALAATCPAVVAPAITQAHPGCAARPPIAISSRLTPRSAPQLISASTLSSLSSVISAVRAAIRLPAGGAW